MAESIRERVMKACFAAASNVAGVNAWRTREDAPVAAEMPCLIQFDGGHEVESQFSGESNYRATVELDLFATASASSALGPALDALYQGVRDAIIGDFRLATGALLALARDVREVALSDPDLNFDEAAPPFVTATLTVAIDYATRESAADVLAA